ncbi:MAG: DUF3644 domain-containing protein [Paracoccaceae bacterium]
MTGFVGKLPRKAAVKELVCKSIESTVLAVEVYNKPTVQFRSAAYAALMVIAWTSALHAVFERDGTVYFHKKKNGRFEKIDGDKKAWELSACISKYTGTHISDDVRANLTLFVKLRNKIEHRQMATLDAHIAPECQALLLNLKDFLQAEFDIELLGDIGLYVPISVFASTRSIPQSSDEKSVISFIDRYRNSLDPRVWQDTKYAFRAFLIPKIGNHENSSDVTIEFLKLSSLTEAQREKATRMATLIRDRQMPFKEDLLKPKMVVEKVRERHPDFHLTNFVNAWKTLKVRPETGHDEPGVTNTRYCYYDPVDKDYRYEPAFVEKICEMIDSGHDFSVVS